MSDYGEIPKGIKREDKTTVSSEGFDKFTGDIPRKSTPTQREFPDLSERRFLDSKKLKLSDLPDGTVIKVQGSHPGAGYTLHSRLNCKLKRIKETFISGEEEWL